MIAWDRGTVEYLEGPAEEEIARGKLDLQLRGMKLRGRFAVVRDHANICPLGSGAIAGTTLPIDREFTAKALGFVDAKGRARVTTKRWRWPRRNSPS